MIIDKTDDELQNLPVEAQLPAPLQFPLILLSLYGVSEEALKLFSSFTQSNTVFLSNLNSIGAYTKLAEFFIITFLKIVSKFSRRTPIKFPQPSNVLSSIIFFRAIPGSDAEPPKDEKYTHKGTFLDVIFLNVLS